MRHQDYSAHNPLEHKHAGSAAPAASAASKRAAGDWSIDGGAQGELAQAVEVRVLWGDNAIFVQQLQPGEDFVIGRGSSAETVDFVVGEGALNASPVPLVGSADWPRVHLPTGAQGWVETTGGVRMELNRAADMATSEPAMPAVSSLPVLEAMTVVVELGSLVFLIRGVKPERPLPRSLAQGHTRSTFAYLGLTALGTAGLLGAMAFFVPPMGLTDAEAMASERLYLMQTFLEASAEREKKPEPGENARQAESGGSSAEAGPAEAGAMGKPSSQVKNRRFQIKGPEDSPETKLQRLAEAAEFGLIGLLQGSVEKSDAPTSAYARDAALGADLTSAQGMMFAEDIGEAAGTGGLGLIGIGEGGGQKHGRVGLDGIGTIGTMGNCVGATCGFGRGHARNGGTHRTQPPRMRSGAPQVSGRIPPHVIQRIVRQNFGRFRLCYERGLMANPNLEGRVSVGFVIHRDGSVGAVQSRGSSLPSTKVTDCVVRAFYGLSFPKPEHGAVTVSYPLMFTPS